MYQRCICIRGQGVILGPSSDTSEGPALDLLSASSLAGGGPPAPPESEIGICTLLVVYLMIPHNTFFLLRCICLSKTFADLPLPFLPKMPRGQLSVMLRPETRSLYWSPSTSDVPLLIEATGRPMSDCIRAVDLMLSRVGGQPRTLSPPRAPRRITSNTAPRKKRARPTEVHIKLEFPQFQVIIP